MLVTRRAATGQCPGRARREGASSPESERQRRDGLEADGHAPSACWTEGKSTPLAEPCSWTLCPRIRESGPPAQASVGRFGAFKNLMRKAQGGRGPGGRQGHTRLQAQIAEGRRMGCDQTHRPRLGSAACAAAWRHDTAYGECDFHGSGRHGYIMGGRRGVRGAYVLCPWCLHSTTSTYIDADAP